VIESLSQVFADPTPTIIAVIAIAGFVAGWVDAVVGGGGLIQLPALLLAFPGASPAQLLATNKLGSIAGTTTASITYWRRVRPDLRTALPMALCAYVGAIGGAFIGLQPDHSRPAHRRGWLHAVQALLGHGDGSAVGRREAHRDRDDDRLRHRRL
jgi:uncharacterized membrane protein YfcA